MSERRFVDRRVVIPRGTQIYSTHPSFDRSGKTSRRKQVVLVHDADYWQCPNAEKMECLKILWIGTGGYWRWAWFPADAEIEIVDEKRVFTPREGK